MAVSVTSSWTVTSGSLASLPGTVASLSESSLDSVTSPETCVLLVRGEDEERGEVILHTGSGQSVTGVALTSSCLRWEVVGGIQYLATLQGLRLDLGEEEEDGEIPVYSASLELGQGHDKVTLRLPPGDTQSCWIFSLEVTLARSVPPPPLGHFSLSSVDSLLAASSLPLSEKAQQFRTMFESFQTSGPLAGPAHLAAHRGEGGTGGRSAGSPPSAVAPQGLSSGSILLLQSYLDEKFSQLEERLVRRMEAAAQIHSDKLDSILLLLRTTAPVSDNNG